MRNIFACMSIGVLIFSFSAFAANIDNSEIPKKKAISFLDSIDTNGEVYKFCKRDDLCVGMQEYLITGNKVVESAKQWENFIQDNNFNCTNLGNSLSCDMIANKGSIIDTSFTVNLDKDGSVNNIKVDPSVNCYYGTFRFSK